MLGQNFLWGVGRFAFLLASIIGSFLGLELDKYLKQSKIKPVDERESEQRLINSLHETLFGYFIGLYNRNKRILTFSAILFFATVFISILSGYIYPNFASYLMKMKLFGNGPETALQLFYHNSQNAILMYFGGIVGIISAIFIILNGFLFGEFLGYYIQTGIINAGIFLIYILPHGIFEFTSIIIACAAGFRLTTLIIGIINKKSINEHYWKLKDSIALIVIAIILLFIAANIEANLSNYIGNYITGLHQF